MSNFLLTLAGVLATMLAILFGGWFGDYYFSVIRQIGDVRIAILPPAGAESGVWFRIRIEYLWTIFPLYLMVVFLLMAKWVGQTVNDFDSISVRGVTYSLLSLYLKQAFLLGSLWGITYVLQSVQVNGPSEGSADWLFFQGALLFVMWPVVILYLIVPYRST